MMHAHTRAISLLSAHLLLSACFLVVSCYKHMRLTIRYVGICQESIVNLCSMLVLIATFLDDAVSAALLTTGLAPARHSCVGMCMVFVG